MESIAKGFGVELTPDFARLHNAGGMRM